MPPLSGASPWTLVQPCRWEPLSLAGRPDALPSLTRAPPLCPLERPDCEAGRVTFVFYAHLRNVKEVYVTTSLDRHTQAVRGQVSQRAGIPQPAETRH